MSLFAITKTIQLIILPPSILIFLLVLGFAIKKKYSFLGSAFIAVGFSLLYLFSIRPVSDVLIGSLESDFPPQNISLSFVDKGNRVPFIVVLTGGAVDLSWLNMQPIPSRTSLARLAKGIALYREMQGSTLVISGGSGEPDAPDMSEAKAMKRLAVSLGVAEKDIIVEDDSRNTIESVRALKNIIGDKRIVLVTSAFHMRRAAAMFKKNGIEIIPSPADFRSEQKGVTFYSLIAQGKYMQNSQTAFSEYLSLMWYKVRGTI